MTYVKRLARNTEGRDIIVGDVHGSFTELGVALAGIDFNPARGDRLFHVGDLVDRGPESLEALAWLTQPWVFAVSGNHEAMLIDHANGQSDSGMYIANGGGWALALTKPELVEFADAFRALPIAIELETADGLVGIVHAECPYASWGEFIGALTDPAVSDFKRQQLVTCAQWMRNRIEMRDRSLITGVRAVVVGHTPMTESVTLGNTIYIDTMGWRRGHFTLLDAATLTPARMP